MQPPTVSEVLCEAGLLLAGFLAVIGVVELLAAAYTKFI